MHYPKTIAGSFASRADAEHSLVQLTQRLPLADDQVTLIAPDSTAVARKVDTEVTPPARKVRRSLVRWHLIMGAFGMLAGLLLAAVLTALDIALFSSSPGYAFFVAALFGLMLGLLAGGLISLRPTQGVVAARVKDDVKSGAWAVLAHARDRNQQNAMRAVLSEKTDRIYATL